MNWSHITTTQELAALVEQSNEKPQLIFKHSTRCSISSMAKGRLERNWDKMEDAVDAHHLDLIALREISNAIAEQFDIQHQSPQVILLNNGKASYHASHQSINVLDIKEAATS